jgi:hypothetical protein
MTTGVTKTDMDRAIQIAKDMYNFDAGVPAQSAPERDFKVLAKLDYTITPEHRASVSYQRTGGNQYQTGVGSSQTTLPLSSTWYNATDTLNTFNGRVTSDWSNQLSSEVEADAKLVSSRVPSLKGNNFMAATIATPVNQGGGGGSIALGPDISRHSNLLDNDVFHGKVAGSYLLATNLIQAGVEYERTYIDNLFIQRTLGDATYANLTAFMNKTPTQIRYANSTTLNPADAAANWNVGLWTAYAQDQVKLTPELTLQGGLRYEVYQTGSRPTRNQNFVNRYNFANNESLEGRGILEPRLGVTWLPIENLNIRVGGGLYSGGTPAVWMSNNYTNDGVRTFSVTNTNAAVIKDFDGRNIPQALQDAVKAGAGNGNVDALDPNFKIPSVWKVGGGADYALDIPGAGEYGKGLELRANYTYTKVRSGVNWKDLRRNADFLPNNQPIGTTPDGRALYPATFNPNRGFDMMLTNDDRGFGHVISLVMQKAFPFGLFLAGSYAYTDNEEVSPGTSSVSTSNYGIVAVIDPNHPDVAVSNYTRKHRFTGVAEYSYPLIGKLVGDAPWKDMKTSFGLFVEARSGQPYSWTFAGRNDTPGATLGATDNTGRTLATIFGEDSTTASRNRELFYVPTDAETCVGTFSPGCKVVLATTGQNAFFKDTAKDDFNRFLDRSGLSAYRGKIAPRNGFAGPRYARWDVRFAQDLPNPMVGQRARVVVDIENFGNLLNSSWGIFRQVPFPYYTPAVDVSMDRANNAYIYSNARSPNPTTGPSNTDVLLSVWRLSVGVMYDF